MTIDVAVQIIGGVILFVLAGLFGGAVSARITKKDVEINYEKLYDGVNRKANQLSDKVDNLTKDVLMGAEKLAKEILVNAALAAKLELMESQRIEYERRHMQTVNSMQSEMAVLKSDSTSYKTALEASMNKLTETEKWLDRLKTLANPPGVTEAESAAIQLLRDKPPTSNNV